MLFTVSTIGLSNIAAHTEDKHYGQNEGSPKDKGDVAVALALISKPKRSQSEDSHHKGEQKKIDCCPESPIPSSGRRIRRPDA